MMPKYHFDSRQRFITLEKLAEQAEVTVDKIRHDSKAKCLYPIDEGSSTMRYNANILRYIRAKGDTTNLPILINTDGGRLMRTIHNIKLFKNRNNGINVISVTWLGLGPM